MSKQKRSRCLCGCPATSPSTISAHAKNLRQEARLTILHAARAVAGNTPLTGLTSTSSRPPPKEHHRTTDSDENTDNATDNLMDVDLNPGQPSFSLNQVWSNRASRPEREDEDLFPGPGSPDQSEDDGNGENLDEPTYLSDDDLPPPKPTPSHIEIPIWDRLTATRQLDAASACAYSGSYQNSNTRL